MDQRLECSVAGCGHLPGVGGSDYIIYIVGQSLGLDVISRHGVQVVYSISHL